MCDRRGVVTICKENGGCLCVGLNLDCICSFFFGPGASVVLLLEGGRWKGGGGVLFFVFVTSLSVRL